MNTMAMCDTEALAAKYNVNDSGRADWLRYDIRDQDQPAREWNAPEYAQSTLVRTITDVEQLFSVSLKVDAIGWRAADELFDMLARYMREVP